MPWARRHSRSLGNLGLLVPILAVLVVLAIVAGFTYLSLIFQSPPGQ